MITGKQKEHAADLYAQTDMTRTQIANEVGVDRRTLNKWIRTGHWDRLKLTAQHLPSLMAERCYHLFGMHCNNLMAERNVYNSLTVKDADVLYRLVCTIEKLGKRMSINESMELMTFFAEHLGETDKKLADAFMPKAETYLEKRAGIYRSQFYAPDQTGYKGTIPEPTAEEKEVLRAEHQADMEEEQEEYEERCKARRAELDAAGLIFEDEDEEAEEFTMADAKKCFRQEAAWVKEAEEELAAEGSSSEATSAPAPTLSEASSALTPTPTLQNTHALSEAPFVPSPKKARIATRTTPTQKVHKTDTKPTQNRHKTSTKSASNKHKSATKR